MGKLACIEYWHITIRAMAPAAGQLKALLRSKAAHSLGVIFLSESIYES